MYLLKYSQKLPISKEECWSFFTNPTNLRILTPDHLGFEMECDSKMYAGQIIFHRLRPLWNIPIEWVTEITHLEEPHYFIDEQRFGPYKFWHHEHRFQSIDEGVEMIDMVYYKMPYGILGKAFHALKVKRELESIFSYRKTKLEELFGIL